MAKENDNALVVKGSDGVTYNLLEGPGKDSEYVVEAYEKLTTTLQINELAMDLANVGKFILMAYCGVIGHLQLEIKVRERLHNVVDLCDDTVYTLNEFDRASTRAISSMGSAYEYLMEGFEDIALETLQDVAETSKQMATESSKLQKRFGDEATEIKKVQTETSVERHKVIKANAETTKNIQRLEGDKSFAQQSLSDEAAAEEKAMKELEKAMKLENEAAEKRREIARNLESDLEKVQSKLDAADIEAKMACNQTATGIFAAIGSSVVHLFRGKTKDDIRAEKVEILYKNVKHQHQEALRIAKEKKEAEDAMIQIQKQHREQHAKELEDRRKKREEAYKKWSKLQET